MFLVVLNMQGCLNEEARTSCNVIIIVNCDCRMWQYADFHCGLIALQILHDAVLLPFKFHKS